jgi:predicted metal-binding transcription factor (methanogenesis marker protein 9)
MLLRRLAWCVKACAVCPLRCTSLQHILAQDAFLVVAADLSSFQLKVPACLLHQTMLRLVTEIHESVRWTGNIQLRN